MFYGKIAQTTLNLTGFGPVGIVARDRGVSWAATALDIRKEMQRRPYFGVLAARTMAKSQML